MKMLLLLLSMTISSYAVLKKEGNFYYLSQKEFSLQEILQDYAKIHQINITFPSDYKDTKIFTYGDLKFEEQKIMKFISMAFNQEGYTLLPNDLMNLIKVINARDVRYMDLPVFKNPEELPNTNNYVQYITSFKYADSAQVARNLRPFMSRYGRVIDEANSNTLIISDTAENLRRIKKILSHLDTEQFMKDKILIEKLNAENESIVVEEKSFLQVISDQHILFIVLFSLVGLIIGFGIRGYMMKKIEGGW